MNEYVDLSRTFLFSERGSYAQPLFLNDSIFIKKSQVFWQDILYIIFLQCYWRRGDVIQILD